MAYAANSAPVAAPKASGFSAFIANLAERLRQYRVYRETYNELSALSDRELNDLGLSRSMIRRLAIDASQDA
ncbi:DUF1127 domain-containing protein [Shimia sp. R9_1]|uniref:DUF1127 domain-containing protein n=1 Tax=unclassified Shimia TaxID=2630038 RepID=UPI001AD967A8|nr:MULTISPECIES: DUF1127 domain-containing protein [unclassified Shimia]MBO9398261.1 DUF1127 domain-containing protein [Shimia sp. R9_2]MBO9401281.1 DUF1127 domain-containing protein [Shimia sp. R9_3]MBO9406742.1 DUF1127 domain-containing protein [Shimia sp. R9_1]